jgi:hypothetical protein
MAEAEAEQDDEVQQREGGVVLEVAEAAANLRRELSPLVCETHVLKSGAHRRPLGLIQSWEPMVAMVAAMRQRIKLTINCC